MKNSCSRTILGCYVGYIVQAIVNNFVPLLFVMFERTYQIPLSKITLLITINFCIQLGIDLLSAWFLDRSRDLRRRRRAAGGHCQPGNGILPHAE